MTSKLRPPLIDLTDANAWSGFAVDHFKQHGETYRAWHRGSCGHHTFDRAIGALTDRLKQFSLRGWHCTRLTEAEIGEIEADGMCLPNSAMLERRINRLLATGHLNEEVAALLRAQNSADDPYRAGMLWFCFFPPGRAGEGGIGRFFRHWGGEALYVHHEDNPVSSSALRGIGIPCVVEAEVPVSALKSPIGLALRIYEQMLRQSGHRTQSLIEHEGAISVPLSAADVRRVIRYPHEDFRELTQCDNWREPICLPAPKTC